MKSVTGTVLVIVEMCVVFKLHILIQFEQY